MQPAVSSPEEQQRIEARIEARLDHLADEDVVVAAIVNRMAFTFEHTDRILQDRSAGLAARPGRGPEAVLADLDQLFAGKSPAQIAQVR